MKFGPIAWLIAGFLLPGIVAAENCPLDNAFLSGIKTGTINPNRMELIAGLAASRRTPGVLWAHNSGSINRLFALETGSKSIDDYTFTASLTDAEDIVIGPGATAGSHFIYVGDIGGSRTSVVIARFAEPDVNLTPHQNGVIALTDQTYFTTKYPDGPHDARGLMVDPVSNDLFVVTYEPDAARLYRINQQILADPNGTMTLVATLPIGLATAADITSDGGKIAVRNTSSALMWPRQEGQSIAEALAGAPHGIPILSGFENNGNSLGFAADASGYYTTGQGPDPALYFFAKNSSAFTTGAGLATITHPSITEVSGVAASRRDPGLLWMHNDGAPHETYLVSTNGIVFAVFAFAAAIDDYEDIAVGPGPAPGVNYVYAGEIGDNFVSRTEIRVFRFEEPAITQVVDGVLPANETVISMLYPDGPHDAEALMVDPINGDLFVVSKENGAFRAYKATQAQLNSGQTVELTLVQSGSFGPVSAGDISADGALIALRHENEARLWRRRAGESVEAALARSGERIPVIGAPIEPNGEGITFAVDSRGYYTMSEGVEPTIYFFDRSSEPKFLSAPQIIGNVVRVAVSGCDGSRIRLEGSNELVAWAPVGWGVVANGVATIDSSGGATLRFYRAIVDGP